MSSATSLSTHCLHVHKEPLDKVPNAKATRDSVEYEIFGMDGIPEEVWKEHRAMKGEADDDSDDESGGNKKPKQGEAAASSAAAYPSYGAPYGYTGYPPFSGYPPMSYPAYPYSGYPQYVVLFFVLFTLFSAFLLLVPHPPFIFYSIQTIWHA